VVLTIPYYRVKRDLVQCHKRPITGTKETYYSVPSSHLARGAHCSFDVCLLVLCSKFQIVEMLVQAGAQKDVCVQVRPKKSKNEKIVCVPSSSPVFCPAFAPQTLFSSLGIDANEVLFVSPPSVCKLFFSFFFLK